MACGTLGMSDGEKSVRTVMEGSTPSATRNGLTPMPSMRPFSSRSRRSCSAIAKSWNLMLEDPALMTRIVLILALR